MNEVGPQMSLLRKVRHFAFGLQLLNIMIISPQQNRKSKDIYSIADLGCTQIIYFIICNK